MAISEYDFNTHKPEQSSNNTVRFNLDGNEILVKDLKPHVAGEIQVVAGYSDNDAVVENNVLEINNAILTNNKYGDRVESVSAGYSIKSDVRNNKLISVGLKTEDVTSGGRSVSGNTTGNTVDFSDGSSPFVFGGYSGSGNATDNTVNISGGSSAGYVLGGYSDSGNATGNTVNFSGSSHNVVYGGDSYSGNATDNTVDISGGSSNYVYGGSSNSGNITITGNTVNISGGSINKNVYSGYISLYDEDNTLTLDKNSVINNTVTYSGGTIGGNIVGGYAGRYNYDNTTKRNTLEEAYIPTGNVLNIGESKDKPAPMNTLSAHNILGFETVNFYLPNTVKHNDVALKLTTTDKTDLGETTVYAFLDNANGLTQDSKIHLIQTAGSLTAPKNNGAEQAGVTNINIADLINVKGYVSLSEDAKNLDLTFKGENKPADPVPADPTPVMPAPQKAPDNAKSLLETKLASTTIINQGANLLLDNVDKINGKGDSPVFGFGFVRGFNEKHKTGSHIKTHGGVLNAGVGANNQVGNGTATAAAFVEYGKGSYDSYLDNGTHGKGDSHFIGGGVLAKYMTENQWYMDGSLRAGHVKSDYQGKYGKFDLSNNYVGMHAGLGKVINTSDNNAVDISARYIYSHTGNNHKEIQGVNVHFDAVNSHRLQVGVKDSFSFAENHSLYGKAIYQYEFDGKATGTTQVAALGASNAIAAPKLKGATGIAEVGYAFDNGKVEVAAGINAKTGKEKGVGGNVGVAVKF